MQSRLHDTLLRIVLPARITVLVGAVLLVAMVSYDTFESRSFTGSALYERLQLWICCLFLADLLLELGLSARKGHFLLTHLFSFLLCVPYVWLLRRMGITAPEELNYVLALLPVLRAAFVLAAVLMSLDAGRVNSMFSAYIVLLVFVLYISSMMFYVAESGVNPEVHSYRSAVYWAVMAMTTTGSQITECTAIGEGLASVLSALGLVLFPVFTIYLANAIGGSGSNQS